MLVDGYLRSFPVMYFPRKQLSNDAPQSSIQGTLVDNLQDWELTSTGKETDLRLEAADLSSCK